MLEIRLRILDARERETDPFSFLGNVEGFPQILTHSTSFEQAENDLTSAPVAHLRQLLDYETTRLEMDEFPAVRTVKLHLTAQPG